MARGHMLLHPDWDSMETSAASHAGRRKPAAVRTHTNSSVHVAGHVQAVQLQVIQLVRSLQPTAARAQGASGQQKPRGSVVAKGWGGK